LPPFGQTLLPQAHQDCPIVGHHDHAHLDYGALKDSPFNMVLFVQ
jgi:hypothetical protein